jgi:methionine aminopeptidase
MIVRKNQTELEKMRAAGLLVYEVLEVLRGMVVEGVSTYVLEGAAEKMRAEAGAGPDVKCKVGAGGGWRVA